MMISISLININMEANLIVDIKGLFGIIIQKIKSMRGKQQFGLYISACSRLLNLILCLFDGHVEGSVYTLS